MVVLSQENCLRVSSQSNAHFWVKKQWPRVQNTSAASEWICFTRYSSSHANHTLSQIPSPLATSRRGNFLLCVSTTALADYSMCLRLKWYLLIKYKSLWKSGKTTMIHSGMTPPNTFVLCCSNLLSILSALKFWKSLTQHWYFRKYLFQILMRGSWWLIWW